MYRFHWDTGRTVCPFMVNIFMIKFLNKILPFYYSGVRSELYMANRPANCVPKEIESVGILRKAQEHYDNSRHVDASASTGTIGCENIPFCTKEEHPNGEMATAAPPYWDEFCTAVLLTDATGIASVTNEKLV